MENWKPFSFLFEKLTPDEFARIFENEAAQTRAFLLSFAPGADYVEAVLDKYGNKEFAELVAKYLSRVEGDSIEVQFIRGVEKHIQGIIGKPEKNYPRATRKNMTIKKPMDFANTP